MLQLKVWYSGVFVVLPVRAAPSVQDVKSNFEKIFRLEPGGLSDVIALYDSKQRLLIPLSFFVDGFACFQDYLGKFILKNGRQPETIFTLVVANPGIFPWPSSPESAEGGPRTGDAFESETFRVDCIEGRGRPLTALSSDRRAVSAHVVVQRLRAQLQAHARPLTATPSDKARGVRRPRPCTEEGKGRPLSANPNGRCVAAERAASAPGTGFAHDLSPKGLVAAYAANRAFPDARATRPSKVEGRGRPRTAEPSDKKKSGSHRAHL